MPGNVIIGSLQICQYFDPSRFILGQAEKEGRGGLNGGVVHIISFIAGTKYEYTIAFIDLQNNKVFLIGSYIRIKIHGVHTSLIG